MSCLELNGQRSIGGATSRKRDGNRSLSAPANCELLYRGLKRPLFVQTVRLSFHVARVCLFFF